MQRAADAIELHLAAGGADGRAIDLAIFEYHIAADRFSFQRADNAIQPDFAAGGADGQPAG